MKAYCLSVKLTECHKILFINLVNDIRTINPQVNTPIIWSLQLELKWHFSKLTMLIGHTKKVCKFKVDMSNCQPYCVFADILPYAVTLVIFTARCYAKPSSFDCVSVTLRYCIITSKRRITQIIPHDSPVTPKSCQRDDKSPVKGAWFCSCDPFFLRNCDLEKILPPHAASWDQ